MKRLVFISDVLVTFWSGFYGVSSVEGQSGIRYNLASRTVTAQAISWSNLARRNITGQAVIWSNPDRRTVIGQAVSWYIKARRSVTGWVWAVSWYNVRQYYIL